MGLSHISVGDEIDLAGSTVVVCVPLYGAHDMFVRCFKSLLEHTPESAPILIADDAGPDPSSERWVRELDEAGALGHRVIWMRNTENLGFVGNCNHAIGAAGRADIVLVNSDVEVAEGWLDGLADAAHSDTLVATATALTNHGTILSVPYRNRPQSGFPQGTLFPDAARRVREASEKLRPEIPTAIGHCVYLRRTALDLVGHFDELFAPAYGEEADFSQRCVLHGLRHVAADDVLVMHHGQASLGVEGARNPRQDAHEALLRSRYPYYEAAVKMAEDDNVSPLARALTIASQAFLGASVTIDGRCLGPTMTGTQVHTLELIGGLARTKLLRLRVIVPIDLGDVAKSFLDANPAIEVLRASDADNIEFPVRKDDLVHRPYQVNNAADLGMLARLGNRVVITHQDLIAYRNPSYFPSAKHWRTLRQFTRESLALADHIVFFSEHAAKDAITEELAPPQRTSVVHIGVDHRTLNGSHAVLPEPPRGHPELQQDPFLLVLGTDFRHKNRVFALKVFAELRERGWNGNLVLAGPTVANGSSVGDEAAYLAGRPELAKHVIVLPAVGEQVKDWLVQEAAGVLYPTTYEGFGLLPFEAASAGTPCFFAHVTSLSELLGSVTQTVTPWDAKASAETIHEHLTDQAKADALVAEVQAVADTLTWDATASQLIDVYRRTIADRGRDSRGFVGDALVLDAKYWGLRNDIGPTGLSLVGPGEPLLPEQAQRTVAGLARRESTRRPFLLLLGLLHRLIGGGAGRNGNSADVVDAEAADKSYVA